MKFSQQIRPPSLVSLLLPPGDPLAFKGLAFQSRILE